MAKFEKGNKKGRGRPRKDPELVEVQKINRDIVEARLVSFMTMTREGLKAVIDNPATSMLDLMVASLVQKAIKEGDHQRLGFLFDRVIGKVKENVDITMTQRRIEEAHISVVQEVPREKLIELIRLKTGDAGDASG